jgi:hypothetical protein
MKTALQDLREDLQLSIDSSNEALNEIEDVKVRLACQEMVKLTLENVIKRIDEELLETEKNQLVEAYDQAEGKVIGGGEQYYNRTYLGK